MKLKNDEEEIEQIETAKKIEDYSFLKSRVEINLLRYKDQLNGLAFRKKRVKKELNDSGLITLVGIVAVPLLAFCSRWFPPLFLVAIVIALAEVFLLPMLIADTVKRWYNYVLMNEKSANLNAALRNKVKSFKDEERFVKNRITECEEVLEKLLRDEKPSEEDIVEMDKLTRYQEYYAASTYKDFKVWPLYILIAAWVIFALTVIGA